MSIRFNEGLALILLFMVSEIWQRNFLMLGQCWTTIGHINLTLGRYRSEDRHLSCRTSQIFVDSVTHLVNIWVIWNITIHDAACLSPDCSNVSSMQGQRCRHWASITPIFGQYKEFPVYFRILICSILLMPTPFFTLFFK